MYMEPEGCARSAKEYDCFTYSGAIIPLDYIIIPFF